MSHIEGVARNQLVLFPESIDDYIEEDNPVQFIDAFVDSLNVEGLGFKYSLPEATGRPLDKGCEECYFNKPPEVLGG